MLATITNFFNTHLKTKTDSSEDNSIDKIQLACAALLIELCKSDHTIDAIETDTLLVILKDKFSLPDKELNELVDLAHQEANESTSIYQFTSLINEEYTRHEKVLLLTNMWEVAFADGNLDRYEEHLIRKVADLIYLSHSDFIKTKIAASQ